MIKLIVILIFLITVSCSREADVIILNEHLKSEFVGIASTGQGKYRVWIEGKIKNTGGRIAKIITVNFDVTAPAFLSVPSQNLPLFDRISELSPDESVDFITNSVIVIGESQPHYQFTSIDFYKN